MTVAPNEIIEVTIEGDVSGVSDVVNVYQFQHTSASSISDADFLTDLAALLRALYDALKGLQSAVLTWRRIRARSITNPGTLIGELEFGTPVVGTSSSSMTPTNAALVSFPTNISRVVPRKYIPLASEWFDADGDLLAGAISALTTFKGTLLDTLTGTSGHTYVMGYKSAKTGTWILPISGAVTPTVVTQRRRRKGVGS